MCCDVFSSCAMPLCFAFFVFSKLRSLQEQMLWSDPHPNPGRAPNPRGCALVFGGDVVDEFLTTNGLQLIVRSHECVPNGRGVMGWDAMRCDAM
jgi:hypothetical protein